MRDTGELSHYAIGFPISWPFLFHDFEFHLYALPDTNKILVIFCTCDMLSVSIFFISVFYILFLSVYDILFLYSLYLFSVFDTLYICFLYSLYLFVYSFYMFSILFVYVFYTLAICFHIKVVSFNLVADCT